MSFTNQITEEITTTVTPHSTSAMTTTNPQNAADTTEPPEEATVILTQQDAPLLQLPGELRNRIYHELLRPFFDKMEKKNRHAKFDPKILRQVLDSLTACRQIHHEAMVILFRTYVARQTIWCVFDKYDGDSGPDFLRRTTSFCRIMKQYSPHARFSVDLTYSGQRRFLLGPTQAKAFVEELAFQQEQVADLRFRRPNSISRKDHMVCPVWRSGQNVCDGNCPGAQDVHWKLATFLTIVEGRIGGLTFRCKRRSDGCRQRDNLILEGNLAQLDWEALESILQ